MLLAAEAASLGLVATFIEQRRRRCRGLRQARRFGRLLAQGNAGPVTLRWVRQVELSAYLGQRVAGNTKALPEMSEECVPHEDVELASGELSRVPEWGDSGRGAVLN